MTSFLKSAMDDITLTKMGRLMYSTTNSILNEIRSESPSDNGDKVKYNSLESLLKAYVNDGITHGWYYNVLVFGETLYIYKGHTGGRLMYYQQAIRLTDDVYLFNSTSTNDHHETREALRDIIIGHIHATYTNISLPLASKKVPNGFVSPSALKAVISVSTTIRQTKALRRYGRERMHERAIENFKYLITVYLDPNGQETLLKSEIKDMVKALRRARKYCKIVDRYIDVLKQLPEKSEP